MTWTSHQPFWLTLISVAETLFFLCSSRPSLALSRKHIPAMGYGRLGSSESVPSVSDLQPSRDASAATRKRRFLWLGVVFAVFLLVASGVSVGLVVRGRMRSNSPATRAPTQAIARACSLTRYPALCVSSLLDFPGALQAGERDLVHISLNMTLHRVGAALYGTSAIAGFAMDRLARAAFVDCMELLEESLDQLSNSLLVVSPPASPSPSSQARIGGASDEDVLTWLSGALTNQDTCDEGLQQVQNLYIKEHMESQMKDLAELVSNCLAIFAGVSRNKDFSGVPIQNRKRRKLLNAIDDEFPSWMGKKDRRLLQIPAANIQADMVVSKDGNGTYKSIADAVKAAPDYSSRRIIIYIKAGRYEENIKVGRKKTNLLFVGDGKSQTVIAGSRSVYDNFTTFHTATFGTPLGCDLP
ncbi:hypothetical protein GW17_00020985 [Ensete ventricosum]|nr:hypothetical protein GW17_00020985 [Ensete ventricosum]